MSDQAPPGWYPEGVNGQRYWDGTAWTEHRAPTEPTPTGNAAGVTGLILSAAGTGLGLIPGFILFVWPLLVAGFIVSIVGLALTGRPKTAAAFGLILSIVGGFTGWIAVFVAAKVNS